MCHLNDKFARKHVFVLFLSLASLTCLLVAFGQAIQIDNDNRKLRTILLVVLVSIGKAMSSAAYNCAYAYTSLMFATRVRNTLLNFAVSMGRIGGIVAPLVNMLDDLVWKQFPYVIFSFTSFTGVIFLLVLPDPSSLQHF